MNLALEQLRPLDARIDTALAWLEERKAQATKRIPREEYDALTQIYWLLRDIRHEQRSPK